MADSDSNVPFVPLNEAALEGADRDAIMGALFESFVTQQGALGLSLLGELPDSSQNQSEGDASAPVDVENAKLVIDQLEMFEFKTQGNLTPEEAAFLRKTITVLHEAMVRVMESTSSASA